MKRGGALTQSEQLRREHYASELTMTDIDRLQQSETEVIHQRLINFCV